MQVFKHIRTGEVASGSGGGIRNRTGYKFQGCDRPPGRSLGDITALMSETVLSQEELSIFSLTTTILIVGCLITEPS